MKPAPSWWPPRRPNAHKGDFGHVLVVGGSRGLSGAPRLAALGALRGGAGLVTVAVPASLEPVVAAGGPWEAMTLGLPERAGGLSVAAVPRLLSFCKKRGVTAMAVGPGLGTAPETRRSVRNFLQRTTVPVVLDADGLNALAGGPWPGRCPVILTPHPGEAARLWGRSVEEVQSQRLAAAASLARWARGICVLKGQGTVVSDGRRNGVNTSGTPAMASGGMGDLLTGLIAALISQVTGGPWEERLFRAAALGVRWHGLAGQAASLSGAPVTATDVAAALPAAFSSLFKSK